MNPLQWIRTGILKVIDSGTGDNRRPALDWNNRSSIPGLYVVGDLAGTPVIKLAMAQGFEVVEHIASLPTAGPAGGGSDLLDLVVVGAGAAGLNAALAAREKGLSCVVLEKEKIANTIEDFPEGKWVYAEPDDSPPKGKLWLDGATKEDLVSRWKQIVHESRLDVRTEEPLVSLSRERELFTLKTPKASYRCRRVILATGQRGNPKKLGVEGEERERVYHRLYSPRKYRDERILVVGGGNSAVEAALTLSERNKVVLSYRGESFFRIFKDNRSQLDAAVAAGRIEVILGSNVVSFGDGSASLMVSTNRGEEIREVPFQHAFVLVGAEVPVKFLRSLGIRLEGEWNGSMLRAAALVLLALGGLWVYGGHPEAFGRDLSSLLPAWAGGLGAAAGLAGLLLTGLRGDRFAWLGISFIVCHTIYGAKVGQGEEFWPFRGWGYQALSLAGRPWSFWYTVLYTVVMTVFGLQALKRWGLERKDRFQIWRYVSLLGFQWIFFFLIPEFLFQWAVKYQWVGERLASDATFAEQAWRSYGLVYAWPLFFYTFFYNPHMIWIVWGVALTFVIIPLFVLFQGKRYCSWICGCGGLAETLGDRWRHLAPKGKRAVGWEWMNLAVLIFATTATVLMLGRDTVAAFRAPADWAIHSYRIYADVWLVGILPVTLYPFLGGKIWCRYWCPLAKLMQMMSGLYTRLGLSRFAIHANDKCIACNECSRNCQVGIDVMSYALKQDPLDNRTSSCIGCGICVTVCPMDTLSFGHGKAESPLAGPGGATASAGP
jgi:thioredoxin reductase/polyferredoxin